MTVEELILRDPSYNPENATSEYSIKSDCPLVCVSGFLAPKDNPAAYWGALQDMVGVRVIFTQPSSVLSHHDRACEIFYELKVTCTPFFE
jgi:hypothetical protein